MTMSVGDTGPDVVEMKNQLRAAGYFHGPDDDFYGEDLAEAVRAYQTAHGLPVTGITDAETWGNIHGDPAYPNNSTGALGRGGGGGPGGGGSNIREKYPQLAHMADNPEIGPIMQQAQAEGWSADKFQAAIMATGWWRSTSDSARQFYNLQHTDPATFQQKVWEYHDQIKVIGGQLGFADHLTDEYVDHFAKKAFSLGLSPERIKAMLVDEFTPLIGTTEKSPILHQMRELAQAYMLKIDHPTMQYWLRAIGSGRQSLEGFRGVLSAQARALFPNLRDELEQGLTLRQITDPYRRQIANMMELDPETIDFIDDPKWRNVIDYVDEKGVHRSMSNQELAKYIRSQNEYWYTRQGKDAAGEMVEGILQDFGAVRR